jgi:hypothetical protein
MGSRKKSTEYRYRYRPTVALHATHMQYIYHLGDEQEVRWWPQLGDMVSPHRHEQSCCFCRGSPINYLFTYCWSQLPRVMRGRPWSLGRWDRGFESRLRQGCLSSSIHHHSFMTISSTLYSLVTNKASKNTVPKKLHTFCFVHES